MLYKILLLNMLILASCSSIDTGLYLAFIDDKNGETILQNEPNVKNFLEQIIASDEHYSVKAFARTAVKNFQYKRTKLMTHSYYLISGNNGEYHTLSYYGTKMAFYSKGTWALDTNSDKTSYIFYLEKNNRWDVKEIFQEDIIDTEKTLKNIIDKIESDTTYYYKDHIKNKPNMNNCNTALYETIVFVKRN